MAPFRNMLRDVDDRCFDVGLPCTRCLKVVCPYRNNPSELYSVEFIFSDEELVGERRMREKKRIMATIRCYVVIFILLGTVILVLLDASDHRYKVGNPMPLYANKVGPFHNPRLSA